jgi:PilZ domain
MQLPVRLYSEVVTALKLLGEKTNSEKRRSARLDVKANVVVGTIAEGKIAGIFTCLTRDISQTGIGLLIARPLAQNEKFLLELPRAHNAHVLVVATTTHTRVLANGIFALGAEFLAPAPAELLRQWQDFQTAATQRLRNVILT